MYFLFVVVNEKHLTVPKISKTIVTKFVDTDIKPTKQLYIETYIFH